MGDRLLGWWQTLASVAWCGQGSLCVHSEDSREVPNKTETLLHPLFRLQLVKAGKTLSVPIPKPEGKGVRSPGLRAKAVCPQPDDAESPGSKSQRTGPQLARG